MRILPDHSFVMTNPPSADITQTFSVKGTWSMAVYHVFDTYGYRIPLKCAGYKSPAPRKVLQCRQAQPANPGDFLRRREEGHRDVQDYENELSCMVVLVVLVAAILAFRDGDAD